MPDKENIDYGAVDLLMAIQCLLWFTRLPLGLHWFVGLLLSPTALLLAGMGAFKLLSMGEDGPGPEQIARHGGPLGFYLYLGLLTACPLAFIAGITATLMIVAHWPYLPSVALALAVGLGVPYGFQMRRGHTAAALGADIEINGMEFGVYSDDLAIGLVLEQLGRRPDCTAVTVRWQRGKTDDGSQPLIRCALLYNVGEASLHYEVDRPGQRIDTRWSAVTGDVLVSVAHAHGHVYDLERHGAHRVAELYL